MIVVLVAAFLLISLALCGVAVSLCCR
jgi:hypothetical protein